MLSLSLGMWESKCIRNSAVQYNQSRQDELFEFHMEAEADFGGI